MASKTILTLTALAGLLLGSPAFAEKPLPAFNPTKAKKISKAEESITLRLGFGYRTINRGERIETYVDQTRNRFTAMPGFGEFLQLSKQLPYFVLELGLSPKTNFLQNDRLEMRIMGEFSSSAIFGDSLDKKTFAAKLLEADLGPTPTTWTQHLNAYLTLGVGASYSPVRWGETVQIRPIISLSGGVSYIDAESVLDIQMEGNEFTKSVGRRILNLIHIYEHIHAVTPQTGWGYFIEPAAELEARIKFPFIIRVKAGYRHEVFPKLEMTTTTDSDGKITGEQVKIKYEASGVNLQLSIGANLP